MAELSKTEKPLPRPENLVIALSSPWKRARVQTILNRCDGESARLLSRLILQENARTRLQAALVVLPVSLFLIRAAPISVHPWYVSLLISIGLTVTTAYALTCLPSRLEKAALETLSQGEDILYIGPCLDVLQKRNLSAPLREKILQALARLLPQCTLEVFAQLTSLQHNALHELLHCDQRDSHVPLHLAVLNILAAWGEWDCLGIVYRQAFLESRAEIQAAARECVEQICHRLNFGGLKRIPDYAQNLGPQLYPSGINYQECAICIMALRRLVPQLTPANVKSILSESQRDCLYELLVKRSLYGNYRYGKDELFLEIIAAAERLRDTRAVPYLNIISTNGAPTDAAKRLRAAAREALQILEIHAEKEKESRVLLRGSSAPAPAPQELLRPAALAPTATEQSELLRATTPPKASLSVTGNSVPEQPQTVLLRNTAAPGEETPSGRREQ